MFITLVHFIMKRISLLIAVSFITLLSFAQGNVTVTQSSAISDIVNNKNSQSKTSNTQSTTVNNQQSTVSNQQPTTNSSENEYAPHTESLEPSHTVNKSSGQPKKKTISKDEDIIEHIKTHDPIDYKQQNEVEGRKVMTGEHKVKGWRIQVYNGGNKRIDKENATKMGEKVKKYFPSMPIYVHFYSPRWMTKCGNFRTHKEAEAIKKELIKLGFKNTSIVRQQLTVE